MNLSKEREIQVAVATPDDVEGMQEIFYRGWLATYPNTEHGITVDDVEDRFKDRYSDERLAKRRNHIASPPPGETTLVAKLERQVVGLCQVVKHADRNQIEAIYVLPEYHGRGIGTALWWEAQRYVDLLRPIFVEVAIYNAQAIAFYKKLGFEDTGKRMVDPRFTLKSGSVIPEMEMRREVQPIELPSQ